MSQEIGDKEQEIKQHGDSLKGGEAELQDLQAKRNGLNDERKELWRSIDDLKDHMKKIKDDKDRAQRGVCPPSHCGLPKWPMITSCSPHKMQIHTSTSVSSLNACCQHATGQAGHRFVLDIFISHLTTS